MGGPPITLVRRLLVVLGVANLVVAVGMASGQAWASGWWPWPDGPLTLAFVGAILAAIGAGSLWAGLSGETGSVPAGALDLAVTLGGSAVFLAGVGPGEDRGNLTRAATVAALLAVGNLGLFLATRRRPEATRAPLPRPVQVAFVAFTAILLAVALGLLLGSDRVMPWPMRPDSAVLVGWIFLGNTVYFAYAVLRPTTDGYRTQLWSFLAYDLVLLPPLLARAPDLPGELRPNLVVYLLVLVGSAVFCVVVLLRDLRRARWVTVPG